MNTLYIYDVESSFVHIVIKGVDKADCEAQARKYCGAEDDDVGWTYAPAFGAVGGLFKNALAPIITTKALNDQKKAS